MYLTKWIIKEEEKYDVEEARHHDRKKWRLNGYRDDGSKIWKKIFVDKYNQPLYDVDGYYIERQLRNKIKNEKEIYYRNNPHKSNWKTNVNKRERLRIIKRSAGT